MTWTKREAVTNLVVLGDEEGNKKKAGGLLIGCPRDRMYPDKTNYELVQQDGEVAVLSGSASLRNQLGELDIGKFVKMEFMGWGKSPNGKYKIIEVFVFDGEPNDVMKAWPQYGKHSPPSATTPKAGKVADALQPNAADDFEEFPAVLEDEDSLPF